MTRSILFVVPSLFPLGSACQLRQLVRQLDQSRFSVRLVTLDDDRDSGYTLSNASQVDDIPITRLLFRPRDLSSIRELPRLLGETQTDILHLWDCPPVIRLGIRRFRGSLIETRFRNETRTMARWLGRLGNPNGILTSFNEELIENVNPATGMSPPKLLAKAAWTEPFDREAKRAEIQQALKIPSPAILIAAAAELIPPTRCKDLIWAIDLLCCIRDDVHLLLLGDGAQRWRLNRFLESTEAQSHVHFLGKPRDAEQLVAAADIFWQADLTHALPDAVLLAMAGNVPLVCALGPTTDPVVRHQQTALAVKYKSRDQFARWTKFLLEQSDRVELMTNQARKFVQENFPVEKMVHQFETIYDSI